MAPRLRRTALVTALLFGGLLPGAVGATAAPAYAGGARDHDTRHQVATDRWVGPGVGAYGDARGLGGTSGLALAAPAISIESSPDGKGYWVAGADGGVLTDGDAGYYGSLGGLHLSAPIVGLAATPDGGGYWMVGMDGGVFSFGDANDYGSLGGHPPLHSIVGLVVTPDGGGYWLVSSAGGVFTFGDAPSYGSLAGQPPAAPIVGMARTPDGRGYWLVSSAGGVFSFGDAGFFGSAANANIGAGVTGLAATPDGGGYWMLAATGGVLNFGDAGYYGPEPNNPPFSPAVAMAATPDGEGYWLLRQDEADNTFSDPSAASSNFPAGARIVAVAAGQLGPDADANQGNYCNPYGPCEQWCALFATWVWNRAGIPIPDYAFSGFVYNWSAGHGRILSAHAMPAPGDGIMYGTGPQTVASAPHMGIVAQVWPDGAIDTIEGDAGPEPAGKYAVVINGPFLPSESEGYNGFGIYGYVQP